MMRILITGASGQLGTALQASLRSHDLIPLDSVKLDITAREDVNAAAGKHRPDVIIHCAAYTDVDGCARHPEIAYRVNGLGTQNVALACQQYDIALVHISSNEVFAGARPNGYAEWMPLDPINPYGESKAAAEFAVRNLCPRHYIVRLAWLFSPGGRNFIHTILDRARSGRPLRVVTDEIGNPTYAADLAHAIGQLIETNQYGTYHLTNAGVCSRYEFAREILCQAGLEADIRPILSTEFKRASTPPPFGAIQNNLAAALGIRLRPWQEALEDCLEHMRQQ
jgi:dTDP-4-dehydrorhamnose reductase